MEDAALSVMEGVEAARVALAERQAVMDGVRSEYERQQKEVCVYVCVFGVKGVLTVLASGDRAGVAAPGTSASRRTRVLTELETSF